MTTLELPVRHRSLVVHEAATHGATTSDRGHKPLDAHSGCAPVGSNLPTGHSSSCAHSRVAGGGTTLPGLTPNNQASAPGDHTAARRAKGVKSNWTTTGKTRAYLISTSIIKQPTSHYRVTYDARRAHTAHTHPDWTPGHSHNDALRIVSKAVLRDLWRASRDYHEGESA